MFDDDRVRGTREQMLLQVDLVRPRDGAGLVLGEDFIRTFMKFLCFQIICNYEYSGLLDNYNLIYTYEILVYCESNKSFEFSRVLGISVLINEFLLFTSLFYYLNP